jgi:hypothetical protein
MTDRYFMVVIPSRKKLGIHAELSKGYATSGCSFAEEGPPEGDPFLHICKFQATTRLSGLPAGPEL